MLLDVVYAQVEVRLVVWDDGFGLVYFGVGFSKVAVLVEDNSFTYQFVIIGRDRRLLLQSIMFDSFVVL